MSFSLAVRRDTLLLLRDKIDAGGGGSVQAFDTAMPPDASSDPGGPPLAVVALAEVSCSLDPAQAVLTFVPAVGNASSGGFPSWVRIVDGLGGGVADFPAGPPGSSAVFIITNEEDPPSHRLYTGGQLTVNGTIVFPG